MNPFNYYIQEKDLKVSRFPYNKVLQTMYGAKAEPYTEFKDRIRGYIDSLDTGNLGLDKINHDIYAIVASIKKLYPDCFEKTGWYTKQVLAYYYEKGRITLDGKVFHINEYEMHLSLRAMELEVKRLEELELAEAKKVEILRENLLKKAEIERKQAILESYRFPVMEGMLFSSMPVILHAYREVLAGFRSVKDKKEHLKQYVELVYGGYGENGKLRWKIVKILKSGGMAYPDIKLEEIE